jgi:AraC family transcriptional regulator
MKTTTRISHAKRIEKVLEQIRAHPGADLDLARLAEVAFMSPYHFHRVYVAMMGETVADTIYTSTPAFVRAFRETYGVTPAQYRRHGELSAAMASQGMPRRPHPASPKGSTMFDLAHVTIQVQPEVRVLALEHLGDYQTISRSFEQLMAWAAGRNLLDQPMRCFALYYDDPASKPKEQLRAEACIAPAKSANLAAVADVKVRALSIPAGRCATYTFKGPYSELDKPYRWLYDTWLAQSGEELAFQPPYEEYLNDARSTPPPQLLTKICLPLKD